MGFDQCRTVNLPNPRAALYTTGPPLRSLKRLGRFGVNEGSMQEKNENGDRISDTHGNPDFSATNGAAYTSSPAIIRSASAVADIRSRYVSSNGGRSIS